MTGSKSILDDIGLLVDAWLQLTSKGKPPRYRHKSAANQVNKRRTIPSSSEFLLAAYRQIDQNSRQAKETEVYAQSEQNWRFTKRCKQSKRGNSAEVDLERAIVQAADDNWGNQVPTSSGLVGHTSDRTRNVDLVHRISDDHYSLIELKVGSDNPLYAAIEILLNGLLFSWSRNNRDKLEIDPAKQPLLSATSIDLCVLAPINYYDDYDHRSLSNLTESINQGWTSNIETLGLPCTFLFTCFDSGFTLSDSSPKLYEKALNRLPLLLDSDTAEQQI